MERDIQWNVYFAAEDSISLRLKTLLYLSILTQMVIAVLVHTTVAE